MRWKKSTRLARRTVHIARKWRPCPAVRPSPRPTSSFIHHSVLPHRKPQVPSEAILPQFLPQDGSFAVFKSSPQHQHKVTVGDLVQMERLQRRDAGEKVIFGTVLMAGTKEWTAIGKPTLQNFRVHCTVEQQTLARDLLVFHFKPRKRQHKFKRVRHWVTMLRVDKIEWLAPDEPKARIHKPVSMIDLFANRWLDERELEFVDPTRGDQLFDSSIENAPGFHQRKCLSEEYRFYPDSLGPKTFRRKD